LTTNAKEYVETAYNETTEYEAFEELANNMNTAFKSKMDDVADFDPADYMKGRKKRVRFQLDDDNIYFPGKDYVKCTNTTPDAVVYGPCTRSQSMISESEQQNVVESETSNEEPECSTELASQSTMDGSFSLTSVTVSVTQPDDDEIELELSEVFSELDSVAEKDEDQNSESDDDDEEDPESNDTPKTEPVEPNPQPSKNLLPNPSPNVASARTPSPKSSPRKKSKKSPDAKKKTKDASPRTNADKEQKSPSKSGRGGKKNSVKERTKASRSVDSINLRSPRKENGIVKVPLKVTKSIDTILPQNSQVEPPVRLKELTETTPFLPPIHIK